MTLIIFPSGEMSTPVYEGRELNLLMNSSETPISAAALKLIKRALVELSGPIKRLNRTRILMNLKEKYYNQPI